MRSGDNSNSCNSNCLSVKFYFGGLQWFDLYLRITDGFANCSRSLLLKSNFNWSEKLVELSTSTIHTEDIWGNIIPFVSPNIRWRCSSKIQMTTWSFRCQSVSFTYKLFVLFLSRCKRELLYCFNTFYLNDCSSRWAVLSITSCSCGSAELGVIAIVLFGKLHFKNNYIEIRRIQIWALFNRT